MRLKKIVLEGFKSFADKTVVCFEEAITGIVGPNGCGKSNIIDAFRWVLGEQSAKSMRGENMKDVIFSGTQKRKAADFAQVTLYFDQAKAFCDQNQLLVSRKVTRKGDSQYLLNGQVVRLKDLQRLFLGSGIGRSSFSIFEQGRIDRIILASQEQRRQVFEEVAGISCFKDQSSDALRKLSQSQANVKRAEDICKEVKARMDKLVKQADKAKDFSSFKERSQDLEQSIFSHKLADAKGKIKDYRAKREESEQSQARLSEELQDLSQERKTKQAVIHDTQKNLEENKRKIYETKSLADLVLQEERLKKERVEESSIRKKSLQVALKDLKEELSTQEKEQKVLEKDKLQAEKAFEKDKSLFAKERERVLEGETLSKRAFDEQKTKQEVLLQAKEATVRASSSLDELNIRLKAQQEKALFFKEQESELDKRLLNLGLKDKRAILNKQSLEIDEMKKSLKDLKNHAESSQKSFEERQASKRELQEQSAQISARLQALKAIERDQTGFSKDIKRLLRESENKKSTLYDSLRPLYEVLDLDEKEIQQFSRFLAPYSQTLFLKSPELLQNVLDFAKTEKLKDFSVCFAPFAGIKEHFFTNIQKAASIDDVQTNLSADWIISDEYFLDRFKVVSSLTYKSDVFSRHAQIQQLQSDFEKKEKQHLALEKELLNFEEKKAKAREKLDFLDQEVRKKEMKLLESNLSLQNALSLEKEIEEEKKRFEVSAGQKKEKEIKEKIETTKKELFEKQSLLKKCEKEALKAETVLKEAHEKVEEQRKILREKEGIFQRQGELLQEKSKAFQTSVMQGKELRQNLEQVQRSMEEIHKIQKDFEEEKKDLKEKTQGFDNDLRSLEKEKKQIEGSFSKEKKFMSELHDTLVKKEKASKQAQQTLFDVSIRLEKQEAIEESLLEQIQEHYPELTIDVILKKKLSKSLKDAEKELKDLRHKMKSLGDVNMEAIKEYEEHKERHDFLSSQLEDLLRSSQDLKDVIADLEEKSRKVFLETFEAIKKSFEKHFITLFSGGEATLHLKGSDPLEGGIDIVAQPPGKQMRSIALLSGGEKCMTALALLFAIFEYKPSTFCLLDEIDAPLDDSNVARFASLLDEFVEKTQFVIVTHNKATMSIAKTLLGISMEEKGISKLLKIHFSGKEQEETALVTA